MTIREPRELIGKYARISISYKKRDYEVYMLIEDVSKNKINPTISGYHPLDINPHIVTFLLSEIKEKNIFDSIPEDSIKELPDR